MTTREEIELLIERRYYAEALEEVYSLDDPLEQIEVLTDIVTAIKKRNGPVEWIPDIMDDAIYISKKLRDPSTRAAAWARIASTFSVTGYYEDAAEFFDMAVEEAEKIENPIERGIVLSTLAYHLAVAGYNEEAYEMFNTAFDTIIGAEISYNLKVDGIIRIGELLEKAGDTLPSTKALNFYRMAFDIFDKLHVNQRAAVVEKKIELALTVYDVGLPPIRQALLEGRNHYALALIEKKYAGVVRLIGELEVALWMKRVNNVEYLDVVDKAFEHCESPRFTETNVQKIARLLTELGSLKRALEFAREIKDVRKRSDALRAIALELAKRKEFEEAREIVRSIPDPRIKTEALTEVVAIEEASEGR
ncbi:hypothetical protein [Thermococcus sp. 21S7]|uniref:hypothetical protein n=1 Tax=Thermococcus sp. 21S7 TaxID=1638221 RepID=UPI00143CBCE3|nr:hypothetical protein [Thermococcus sp. 21S7]NJE62000.1 hypothetical protein [Thermococcus sp. 21S7]